MRNSQTPKVPEQTIHLVLATYLKHKTGETYSKTNPDKRIGGQEKFAEAVQFLNQRFSDESFIAICSDTGKTALNDYGKERTSLFGLLDKSISFDQKSMSFAGFSEIAARGALFEEGREEVGELRDLHGRNNNLGIREKVLNGDLNSEPWLTDLDLKRLLIEAGVNDLVTITPADSLNIATVLHFSRTAHAGSPESYEVPLLLNKGSSGNISSQGTHWVYAIAKVNPGDKTVHVKYRDSRDISEAERMQVETMFVEAVEYTEIEGIGSHARKFEAFPGYSVSFDINSVGQQLDGWTCGYRAVKGLLTDMTSLTLASSADEGDNQSAVTALSKLRDCAETPKALRDSYLRVMLESMEVSNKKMKEDSVSFWAKEAFVGVSDSSDSCLRIGEETIQTILEFLEKAPATHAGAEMSFNEMRKVVELDREANKNLEMFRTTFKQVDQSGKKVLEIDINKVFDQNEDEVSGQAKAKAIALLLNEHEAITQVKFTHTEGLAGKSYFQYFVDILDQVSTIENFAIESTDDLKPIDFDKALTIIGARNALLKLLKVETSPKRSLWWPLWEERFSNPMLYRDKYPACGDLTILSHNREVDSSDAVDQYAFSNAVNQHAIKMGGRYLSELFFFLERSQQFLESRHGEFPYKTLLIDINNGKNERETFSEYLSILANYLEKERAYFPFKKLDLICENGLEDPDFVNIQRILIALNEYPSFEKITFQNQPSGKCEVFTDVQFATLTDLFTNSELLFCLNVQYIDKKNKKKRDGKVRLENIIASNRRQKNIEARKASGNVEKQKPKVSDTIKKAHKKDGAKDGAVRSIKLNSASLRVKTQVDVSAEHQTQVGSQYQLESQLAHAVQQGVQLKKQQENNIESVLCSAGSGSSLIDKEIYITDEGCQKAFSIVAAAGCDRNHLASYFDLLVDAFEGAVGKVWEHSFGKHSLTRSIKYVTESAGSKISNNPLSSAEGFNIDNLPAGFYMAEHKNDADLSKNGFVLCYSGTKVIENKNQSPLTTLTKPAENFPEWPGSSEQYIPGDQSEYFDGCVSELGLLQKGTKGKLIKFMRGLNPGLADSVKNKHKWCLVGDTHIVFDDGDEAISIMDVLFHEGVEGVDILLDTFRELCESDPELYQHFKENFIAGKKSLLYLMQGNSLKLISQLTSLLPPQKNWWKQLVSSHKKHIGISNFETLYNGFSYFLDKWPDGLPLPKQCPITKTYNMLTSLDRLLGMLGKVPDRNLSDQVNHLKGLDFGPEGAWYAARWDGYKFIHLEMKLTGDCKGEMNDYKVWLDDLKKFDDINFEEAVVKFHRYIGRADRIATNYELYTSLIERLGELPNVSEDVKLRLLPILAVATTGLRGSHAIDSKGFFETIQDVIANDSNKIPTVLLGSISAKLNTLPVNPNLKETGVLIKLLHNGNATKDNVNDILDSLTEPMLQGFCNWDKNTAHLSEHGYLQVFGKLKDLDSNNADLFSKVIASLRTSANFQEELDNLVGALTALQQHSSEKYEKALSVLSTIDIDNTKHIELPTIAELTQAVTASNNALNKEAVYNAITEALPNCSFNIAAAAKTASYGMDAELVQMVENFNLLLAEFKLPDWDKHQLMGEKGVEYFNEQLDEIYKELPNCVDFLRNKMMADTASDAVKQGLIIAPDEFIVYTAKKAIAEKLKDCQKAVYLGFISTRYAKFPALSKLELIFPQPTNFSSENIPELDIYKKEVGGLFETLARLHDAWGDAFNVNFLLNSDRMNGPTKERFTANQLSRIFNAIEELNLNYVPSGLFKAVFGVKFEQKSGVNTEQLAIDLIEVLQLDTLTLGQKIKIVELIGKNPSANIRRLPQTLRLVPKDSPELQQCAFTTLHEYFRNNNNGGESVLDNTNLLLRVFSNGVTTAPQINLLAAAETGTKAEKEQEDAPLEKNDPVLLRFFSNSQSAPEKYKEVLYLVVNDLGRDNFTPKRQKDLVKVLAYSGLNDFSRCTEEQKDKKMSLIPYLVRLIKDCPADFDDLAKLFNNRPYPGFEKIKDFLISEKSYKEFFINYELDPPGLRSKQENLEKQFEVTNIDVRIDEMRDLDRNNPLFYTHREQLMNHQLYVNAVGRTHNLSTIDKSAKDLTRSELQLYIKDYRKKISDEQMDPHDKLIAKLDFVALANEAMYRTTGMFPRSTQTLCLLNTMLHGGSVFSQIRTGEGKGIITSLFSASKWMEGGAVDVCSANMELASRDYEEFEGFYEYLGIETSLIRTNSPHKAYKQDGINYSNVAEMALFQEQMQLECKKLPEKVSLVYDEGDRLLDETTQFRYATSLEESSDPNTNPDEWAYPIVLKFVQQKDEFLHNDCSKEKDIEDLRDFVDNPSKWKLSLSLQDQVRVNEFQSKFDKFSNDKLDRWIDSAFIASQLVEKTDFSIRDASVIRDEQETPVRIARVKIDQVINEDSTFSNGVQQFLHARLNIEKTDLKRPFLIDPEKTYLASKSAKNFVDYYLRSDNGTPRGDILGLTGTVGSTVELKELRDTYGFKFFNIPPHEKLNREDLDHVIAKPKRTPWLFGRKEEAKDAHFRVIKERVIASIHRGQPVLLICDGYHTSNDLHEYLAKELCGIISRNMLQLYNGELYNGVQNVSPSDVIRKAGENGKITISTPIFGRGTDIKPINTEQGLYVLHTYIAAERDHGQIIGRSGRNGMPGISELILSEDEFTGRGLSVPAGRGELKRVINTIQLSMTETKTTERKERQAFADIHDQFFRQYVALCRNMKDQVVERFNSIKADHREPWDKMRRKAHSIWGEFVAKIDYEWSGFLNEMRNHPELSLDFQIKALTKVANPRWKLVFGLIEYEANSQFKKEYNEANLRFQPDETLEAKEISRLDLGKQKGAEEKLAEISAKRVRFMMDLSAKPLVRAFFNVDQAYWDVLGGKTQDPELIKQSALNEMLRSLYKKGFLKDPDEKNTTTEMLISLLKNTLNELYKAKTSSTPVGLTGQLINFHQEIVKAVEKFGTDQEKDLVYSIHKEHLTRADVLQYPRYVQYTRAKMYQLRDRGVLKKDASLNARGLFDHNTPEEAWNDLYTYASQKLQAYSGTWMKSFDRKKALKDMRARLVVINNSGNTSSDKINQLQVLVNEFSTQAITHDKNVDAARWRRRSLRNSSGSRFQTTLDEILAKTMLAVTGIKDVKVDFSQQVQDLKPSLEALQARAGFVQLMSNNDMKDFNNDRVLLKLISSLGNNESDHKEAYKLKENYQILQTIKAHLEHYDTKFRLIGKSNSYSEQAFAHLFNDIRARINDFEVVLEQSNKRVILSTPENKLRDALQESLHKISKVDDTDNCRIDTDARTQVSQNAPDTPQVKAVLHEIERHVTLQYGNAVVNKVEHSEENATFSVTATFNDANDDQHTISIDVSGIGQDSSPLVCNKLTFKKADASLPNRSKSTPNLLATKGMFSLAQAQAQARDSTKTPAQHGDPLRPRSSSL